MNITGSLFAYGGKHPLTAAFIAGDLDFPIIVTAATQEIGGEDVDGYQIDPDPSAADVADGSYEVTIRVSDSAGVDQHYIDIELTINVGEEA